LSARSMCSFCVELSIFSPTQSAVVRKFITFVIAGCTDESCRYRYDVQALLDLMRSELCLRFESVGAENLASWWIWKRETNENYQSTSYTTNISR
jgi:hypothetical protein